MVNPPISVIGTTTWGTTLAIINAKMGKNVSLIARTTQEAKQLINAGENPRFLPGYKFPETLRITSQIDKAMFESKVVIVAVPSAKFRETMNSIREHLPIKSIIVIATKGLEHATGKRMSEIVYEEIGQSKKVSVCSMSGPNLAEEIIMGKPSSTVVACEETSIAHEAQSILKTDTIRIYTNSDIVGVEISGAMKNTIAIAAGISDGLELGNNAKASLITRGLSEITRLGIKLGAKNSTFYGLSGVGDLIATCSSQLSRNNQVGRMLAQGMNTDTISATMDNVAEGIDTTKAIMKLCTQENIEMPIAEAVYKVLIGVLSAEDAVKNLMLSESKSETT